MNRGLRELNKISIIVPIYNKKIFFEIFRIIA